MREGEQSCPAAAGVPRHRRVGPRAETRAHRDLDLLARRPGDVPQRFAFQVDQPKVRRECLDRGNVRRTHQPSQQRPRQSTRCGRRYRAGHLVFTVNSLPRPGSNGSGSER